MAGAEHVLFVYGTLMRGEFHHPWLAAARFLGEAITEPRYELVDLDAFPALVAGGTTAVRGEVYAVDHAVLGALDELEEHPGYYRRAAVRLADGRAAEAYFLPPDEVEGAPRIASGDWRSR